MHPEPERREFPCTSCGESAAVHPLLAPTPGGPCLEYRQAPDETIQLRFDLVKSIIDVKLAEQAAALIQRENAEKKQRILAIIAQKEDQHLQEISLDDLRAMLADL